MKEEEEKKSKAQSWWNVFVELEKSLVETVIFTPVIRSIALEWWTDNVFLSLPPLEFFHPFLAKMSRYCAMNFSLTSWFSFSFSRAGVSGFESTCVRLLLPPRACSVGVQSGATVVQPCSFLLFVFFFVLVLVSLMQCRPALWRAKSPRITSPGSSQSLRLHAHSRRIQLGLTRFDDGSSKHWRSKFCTTKQFTKNMFAMNVQKTQYLWLFFLGWI
jgi:hypothetical protein